MNNNMFHKKTNKRRLFLRQLGEEELCLPAIKNQLINVLYSRLINIKTVIKCMYVEKKLCSHKCRKRLILALAIISEKYLFKYRAIFIIRHKRRRKTRQACYNYNMQQTCNKYLLL